jgi:EKC/KEOPS complex subunit PCC1/LAGE3
MCPSRTISYVRAATVRLLRLASNSFLSSADLVLRTMGEFAPDPNEVLPTDEDLDVVASRAREEGGGRKGIELTGGAGAGSGEELK